VLSADRREATKGKPADRGRGRFARPTNGGAVGGISLASSRPSAAVDDMTPRSAFRLSRDAAAKTFALAHRPQTPRFDQESLPSLVGTHPEPHICYVFFSPAIVAAYHSFGEKEEAQVDAARDED
jgi:hypothetical protein